MSADIGLLAAEEVVRTGDISRAGSRVALIGR